VKFKFRRKKIWKIKQLFQQSCMRRSERDKRVLSFRILRHLIIFWRSILCIVFTYLILLSLSHVILLSSWPI